MSAPNFIDLTGKQFGKWLVIKRDIEKETAYKHLKGHKGSAQWLCKCSCGTIRSIPSGNLLQHKTNSCNKCSAKEINSAQYLPHIKKYKYDVNNMIGHLFGRLTVISKDINSQRNKWICNCQCGNTLSVDESKLVSGHTRSCGCLQKESARQKLIDLTGQKFGKLTVIERAENKGKRTCWKCKCECGNYTIVDGIKLISNHTSSCGCIKSYGEYVVKTLLQNQNISYLSNVNFFNLKGEKGYKLRFDFIVNPNDNPYIIEIDGFQHFNIGRGIYSNKTNYNQLHKNDMVKNNYCFDNNIMLIRIPMNRINKTNISINDLLPGSQYVLTKENIDNYYKQRQ